MNKDIDREKSVQIVSSKYFSKSAMDESLSDFQEPKKIAGPKQASKKTKDKPKKAPKRIRGQKDIRKALKPKKNELESYSKDFDHVCRQAGLDVDSEQLQLAIALSKSLQSTYNSAHSSDSSQSQNSQDRVGKIRTTLLEYGFKVPEIKITTTSRRLKKRKHYKLLETSEEAKNQIIADKYSQVLFENIILSKNIQSTVDIIDSQLYNLATNATYRILNCIDTFYVDGLLEISTSTGNLLRDWSEIPGRPVSPKIGEPANMNFSEIECSQDELDIVLSGTLKSCKNIIKTKEKASHVHKFSEQKELVSIGNLDNSVIVLLDDEKSKSNDEFEALKLNNIKTKDFEGTKEVDTTKMSDGVIIDLEEPIAKVNQNRSCSPDLFDDEPSTVIDDTNQSAQENKLLSQEIFKAVSPIRNVLKDCIQDTHKENQSYANSQMSKNTNVTRFNDFMEITDCVDIQCMDTDSNNKTLTLKLSQNVTKRKSNDFMEITNCVKNPVPPLNIEADVDLTQSPETKNCIAVVSVANEFVQNICYVEKLDESISQNIETKIAKDNIDKNMTNKNIASNLLSNDGLTKVMSDIEDNNIDLTASPVKNNTVENLTNKSIESLDLTQSSNTSEELPFVSLKSNNKAQSADDTIIMNPKDYEDIEKSAVLQHNDEVLNLTQNITHEEINHGSQESQNHDTDFGSIKRVQNNVYHSIQNEQNLNVVLDLTQEIVITSKHNSKTSDTNMSFFGDYVHNHSDNNDQSMCDDNFYKDASSKENGCLDVDDDTTYKNTGSSDIVSTMSPNVQSTSKQNKSDDIDLTQNSESSEEFSQNSHKNSKLVNHNRDSETDNAAIIEMEIGEGSQSDIDLTQQSESEEEDLRHKDPVIDVERDSEASIDIEIAKTSQRCSSLGKKDDVSIDYDELYEHLVNRHSNDKRSKNSSTSAKDNNTSNNSNKSNDIISNCSQDSEVFVISDNELDYSMHQSKLEKPDNFLFGGLSIMDQLSFLASIRKSINSGNNSATDENELDDNFLEDDDINQIGVKPVTPVKHKRVNELATPQKPSCSGINRVVTPSNSQYVIKTVDVTPMPKYESMSVEELHSELDKYGVKPFKRKRAVQLLTHIYTQTHPTVEPYSDEESPCKRRKTNDYESPQKQSPRKLAPRKILSPKKTKKSPRKISEGKNSPKKVSKKSEENAKDSMESDTRLNDVEIIQIYKNHEVNETPVIKDVECSPDDWVFQKREKAKVHSCRVPLHIAFHNYVSSRPGLREAILCYEPINIDDVHKDLVGYGHRYDPKDLLKFMDKKCITVKTTDNDARNTKR